MGAKGVTADRMDSYNSVRQSLFWCYLLSLISTYIHILKVIHTFIEPTIDGHCFMLILFVFTSCVRVCMFLWGPGVNSCTVESRFQGIAYRSSIRETGSRNPI